MTRDEVLAVVQKAGVVSDDDPNDPDWLTIAQWGMELRFDEEDARLRQIAIDDTSCLWAGKPVLGQPLHKALDALGDAVRHAGWRPENAVNHHFDDLEALSRGEYLDEALMDEGTLWLPVVKQGLVMLHGHVKELVWRLPEDVPRFTVCGVRSSQLQLSQRPDLAAYLKYWRPRRRRMTPFQAMLTGAFVLSLIGIVVCAAQEQQAWQMASTATARVISIDHLPAGIGQKPFHVEFRDADGAAYTAGLEAADFYVAPSNPGDEVEVRYLLTEPIQVKGPARVQDAAFTRYMPWAIGSTALYAALMTLVGWFVRWRVRTVAE